jgi:hypothetical protein
MIFFNYLYGEFIWEFLPILPLPMLKIHMGLQTKFYLVKTIRLFRGMRDLNVPDIMKNVKEYYKNKLLELEKENPRLADDSTVDNTKMKDIIFISLSLKTFKLILSIFNFSFFLGMGWLLLCITLEEYKTGK